MCNGPFENVMYIQLTNCKSQSSQTGVKIVKTFKINIFFVTLQYFIDNFIARRYEY